MTHDINTEITNNGSDEKTLIIKDKTLKGGFTAIPNTVLCCEYLSPTAKVLYCLLLMYAWQEKETFPGQERLAKALGRYTTRNVRFGLNELKDAKLISWKRRGLTLTNIYTINSLEEFLVWNENQKLADVPPKRKKGDRKYISGQERNCKQGGDFSSDRKCISAQEGKSITDQKRKCISDKKYTVEKYTVEKDTGNDIPSTSSLRSDVDGHCVKNPERPNEPTPSANEDLTPEDIDSLTELLSDLTFLEAKLNDPIGDFPCEITIEEIPELSVTKEESLSPKINRRQKKSKSSDSSAVIKSSTDLPEKPSEENQVSSDQAQLTNKDIIGSLGDTFLETPGMAERYPPGPQRKRIYALMGRLYHRLDCEPVYRAIEALKKKLASGQDLNDPLRYVAGAAKKCAQQIGQEKTAGQNADDFYAAVKKIGEENAPTKEQRRLVREWYAAEEERAARYWREREEEEERLRAVLETHYDDPLAEAIAEIQRDYAREKLYGTKDVGGAKHIGSCLDRLKTASN